jgi:hypothetical protein
LSLVFFGRYVVSVCCKNKLDEIPTFFDYITIFVRSKLQNRTG